MRIFNNKTVSMSAEDSAFAERLSAIATRVKVDLCPVIVVPEPPVAPQTISQLFWSPAELLAESAGE